MALAALLADAAIGAELGSEITEHLTKDEFVYIASTRKGGDLGEAAEIWFYWDGSALFVASPPKAWRVVRIRAGRPQARIWVGSVEGSWFDAKGEIVSDVAAQEKLVTTFREKYGVKFSGWHDRFRDGFKDGSRLLIRYAPTGKTGKGPEGLPPDPTAG
jgi:hypothetical protein